ncbi:MAG TPA: hypothetical protein VK421_05190 [Pyrinomonadaceae bacterium]|nr:hypothetical protein [Pyrinomonadaceae bacterium]
MIPLRRTRRPDADAGGGARAPLLLSLAVLLLCHPGAAQQPQPAAGAQHHVTQSQADLYERWRSNINLNQQTAYEAGREYLSKYPADGYAAYVRPWVAAYERESRKREFARLFKAERFAEVFKVGGQVLAEEPEHLKTLTHLAYAGYLAAGKGDETYNDVALNHARKAVALIDAGAQAADWQPFAGRADALGYLHFIIGELSLKPDPEEAIRSFRKAVSYETSVRHTPVLYSRLAAAYVVGRYDPLSKDYQSRFAGREADDESRAALEKIYGVVDLIADAYARAVALAGTDPKYAEARRRWSDELTRFYKFRHKDSTDGLEAYVAAVVAKPLPE